MRKVYKIEPLQGGYMTSLERADSLILEWRRIERLIRLYDGNDYFTNGFTTEIQPNGDVHMIVDTTKNRKFWNVHSEIVESDLDILKALLDQDFNAGQWEGYKNEIINGNSGKINGNQVIPNTWVEI